MTTGAPAERALAGPQIAPTPLPRLPAAVARTSRRAARTVLAVRAALRSVPRSAPGEAVALRGRVFALSRLFADVCALHGLKVVSSGPVPSGPVVLVANHVGYFDPLVLAGLVPCLPLAKREVSSWPLIGKLARRHGVVFVERENPLSGAAALRAAGRALTRGVSVLNFPEGTTTTGASVLRFKRGIFGLAGLTGVTVVPVAIGYDDEDLAWTGDTFLLPHYLKAAARERLVVRVRFGCAMTPSRYGGADALAAEAQAVVEHLLSAA
ncbi:MAG TPA: lysophospholipid acyltransferase family protein [Candidatus Bathyarchaeia archaeon]|nr:lysophospholipid acyltransferase family protein [Candidatus Bathyarchaeia archaeon]